MADPVAFTDDFAIVDLSSVGVPRASGKLTLTAHLDERDGPLLTLKARGVSINKGAEYVMGSIGFLLADALGSKADRIYITPPIAQATNRSASAKAAERLVELVRDGLRQAVAHSGFHQWYLAAVLRHIQYVTNPDVERRMRGRAEHLAKWAAQAGPSATNDPDYIEDQRYVNETMATLAMNTDALSSVALNPLTSDQCRIAVTLLTSGHSLVDSIEASRRI